jgi:hypothetical protein
MELGMNKIMPLMATPSSYFLFPCTNIVDVQSCEVGVPLVPSNIGSLNEICYEACSICKVH